MFNKPLIIALLISLSLNALLVGISKHLYDDKAKAVHSLKETEKTVLEQQKAYELVNKACVIGDEVSASFWKGKQNSDKQKESDISKIGSIPKKSVPILGTVSPKAGTIKATGTNYEIDIDSKLPDVLISVLSESCLRAKGSSCEHP